MPNPVMVRRLLAGGAGMAGSGGTGLLSGLISYWKLDEAGPGTRFDARLAHNLTDHTNSLGSVSGIINSGAGPFGPTADTTGLGVANNSDFQMGTGKSFTINLWTFASGSGNNSRHVISKWASSGSAAATEYILYTVQGGTGFYYNSASFRENGVAQKDIIPNGNSHFQNFAAVWMMFAFGYDAVNQLAFLKSPFNAGGGVFSIDTQTVACTNILGTTQDFVLGNNSTYTFGHWGSLDEVGFWNRVLSDSELVMLYNGGAAKPFSTF